MLLAAAAAAKYHVGTQARHRQVNQNALTCISTPEKNVSLSEICHCGTELLKKAGDSSLSY